eukprot:CAMPEP_0174714816 /NCGR_PEP_ID=MMETSP1094-20130205/19358_1 /TAXON_ID=156173 /ORGANISM="Chrysochromulina brevifilum, Strain UTEX LB 985" /LENGTH=61 /DNA_ID=CAMNT_0015914257 /DNA_START=446 /DNA_END=631 /DNA_ORIENTATION=+
MADVQACVLGREAEPAFGQVMQEVGLLEVVLHLAARELFLELCDVVGAAQQIGAWSEVNGP